MDDAMEEVQALIPGSLWSEGPNPGVLQELVDNIDRHSDLVRLKLFRGLGAVVQQHPSKVDKALMAALAALAPPASSGDSKAAAAAAQTPEHLIGTAAAKFMELQRGVDELQGELRAAQAAADLEATLAEFRGFLENGQYGDAAWSVVQLRKIAEASAATAGGGGGKGGGGGYGSYGGGATDANDANDAEALRAACARCEQALGEALEAARHEALDVERGGHVLTITPALPSGGDVGGVWAAMETAGVEAPHLRAVAAVFLSDVLPPVLSGAARLHAHASPGGESAIVQWQPSGRAPGAPATPRGAVLVEADCAELLRVLSSQLFRNRPSTIAAFGREFWAPFVALHQQCFAEALGGAGLDVLRARQAAAAELEALAVELGLVAPGASELSGALARAIQASHHAAQEAALQRARELLLSHDAAEAPLTVGQPLPLDGPFYERYARGLAAAWELLDPPAGWDAAGPVLAAGFYQVSHTAMQLAMAMDDALSDAVASGDASAASAAADAVARQAALFPALMPPPDAAAAPHVALLRHNDLLYLANHLLLLPYLYGPALEALAGREVWYGDDAGRLRAGARAALDDTLAVQQRALAEPLAELRALASNGGGNGNGGGADAGQAGISARKAGRALLHTLGRAGRLAWTVLPPAAALDVSARLLGPLFSALASDILAKQDIGVDEGTELVAVVRPLVDGAVDALLSGVDAAAQVGLDASGAPGASFSGGASASGGGAGAGGGALDLKRLLAEAVSQRAAGLRKLGAVVALLDAKLADIVVRWESGELRGAGLSLAEVGRLVRAVFEDTDYRAQCLQRMEVA